MLLLIKFGNEENITKLVRYGEIYMPLNVSFRQSADDDARYDPFEGAISNEYDPKGIMKFSEDPAKGWKQFDSYDNRINNFDDGTTYYSYSLFCVTLNSFSNGDTFKMDPRMRTKNWTHCALITRPKHFIDQVRTYLAAKKIETYCSLVEYYDEKTRLGNLTPFHKSSINSYQNEYRIVAKSTGEPHLKFSIGDISDFVRIEEAEATNFVKIKNNGA